MQMYLTNAGLTAINQAQLAGVKIDIVEFQCWRSTVAEISLPYVPDGTETVSSLTTAGWLPKYTGGVPANFDTTDNTDTVQFDCEMDETIGDFDYDALLIFVPVPNPPPGPTPPPVLFGVVPYSVLVKKRSNLGPSSNPNSINTTVAFTFSNATQIVNINLTNVYRSYNEILEFNTISSVPTAGTGHRIYRVTRAAQTGGGVGVNSFLVHSGLSQTDPQPYQNSELVPDSHSLVWDASDLKTVNNDPASGFALNTLNVILKVPEMNPLISAKLPDPYEALILTFFESLDANKGVARQVTGVATAQPGNGFEYIRFTLDTALPFTPSTGVKIKVYSPSGTGGGIGAGGGQNQWVKVTASNPSQAIFNTFPVSAYAAIVSIGAAYQPPDPLTYSVTGPFQITFTAGVPGGTEVHFTEHTLDYNNVIPGGAAGFVLVKNSGINGDYTWQDPSSTAQNNPIVLGLKRAAMCYPMAKSVASLVTNGGTFALTQRWAGGVLGQDGRIYGVPCNSDKILVVDPVLQTVDDSSDLGAGLSSGTLKWWGGALGADGRIYCAPYNSTSLLIIEPKTGTASTLGITQPYSNAYRGAVLANNGKIYCIPNNATDVLVLDTTVGPPGFASFSYMGVTISGGSYEGGCLGLDGRIYCPSSQSNQILVIDPDAGTVSETTLGATISGTNIWAGLVMGPDGKLYGVPLSGTGILRIDTSLGVADVVTWGPTTYAGTFKWAGGCVGPDGKIYCIPSDSDNYLVIDVLKETATEVGAGLTAGTLRYKGGVLAPTGDIYGVPFSSAAADGVLCITNVVAGPLGDDLCVSPYLNKY